MKPATKVCSHCGERQSINAFPTHARSRDGHMGLCRECYGKKTKQREVAALTAGFKPAGNIPEPEKPHCTCTPRKHYVVERMRRRVYIVHSALCMTFKHNQLDNIPRSSSLADEAMKYGG